MASKQFFSGKRYLTGFPCTFRNWRADSHCRHLHGYDLRFEFEFSALSLDKRGWVVDFGGLKELKAFLEDHFDHKTLIASDDPGLEDFRALDRRDFICLRVVPGVGAEAFANLVYEFAEQWLRDASFSPRCSLESVTVSENEVNYATVRRQT